MERRERRVAVLAGIVALALAAVAGVAVAAEEAVAEELGSPVALEAGAQQPPQVPAAPPHVRQGQSRNGEAAASRFGLGLGAGLVDAGPTTEPYLMAGLRMRFGREDRHEGGGLGGYLEPEVGYWRRSAPGITDEDLLIGVNVGGLVQLQSVSYFVAAGLGMHFIDTDRFGVQDDTTSLGVNVQFGVDVHVTPALSLFGVGRVDLVEEWDDETQAKIYLGLRAHF
jgi:hypothetical protein